MGQIFSSVQCFFSVVKDSIGETMTYLLGIGACGILFYYNQDLFGLVLHSLCCFRVACFALLRVLILLFLFAVILYFVFANPVITTTCEGMFSGNCPGCPETRQGEMKISQNENNGEPTEVRNQGIMTDEVNDNSNESETTETVKKIVSRLSEEGPMVTQTANKAGRSLGLPDVKKDDDTNQNVKPNNVNPVNAKDDRGHDPYPTVLLLDYAPPYRDNEGHMQCSCSPRRILLMECAHIVQPQPNCDNGWNQKTNRIPGCNQASSPRAGEGSESNDDCVNFPPFPSVEHNLNRDQLRNTNATELPVSSNVAVDKWFLKPRCISKTKGFAGRRKTDWESDETTTSANKCPSVKDEPTKSEGSDNVKA